MVSRLPLCLTRAGERPVAVTASSGCCGKNEKWQEGKGSVIEAAHKSAQWLRLAVTFRLVPGREYWEAATAPHWDLHQGSELPLPTHPSSGICSSLFNLACEYFLQGTQSRWWCYFIWGMSLLGKHVPGYLTSMCRHKCHTWPHLVTLNHRGASLHQHNHTRGVILSAAQCL